MNKKYKVAIGLAAVALVAFFIYLSIDNAVHFRVTSQEPGSKAPQFAVIILTFNKNLSAKKGTVEFSPGFKTSTLVKGSQLYIYPQTLFNDKQTYSVLVRGFVSSDGKTMEPYSFVFTVDSRIKPNSQAQQEAQVLATDAEQRNPLIRKLPYDATTYKITAVISGDVGDDKTWRDFKDNYFIKIQTFAYQGLPAAQYKAKTLRFRNDALQWLRDQGVDPNKDVRIYFDPTDDALNGTQPKTSG